MAGEFAWRQQPGFPILWLIRAALKDEYGLTIPPAILSKVAARAVPLAYGGNGITYSMPGAGLLRAQVERRPHPFTALFSFTQLAR